MDSNIYIILSNLHTIAPHNDKAKTVSRHRSGEGYQNISAALKVPKNTVASSFLNGRSLEPPRLFLELAARPN
jgi:hypothetical protein